LEGALGQGNPEIFNTDDGVQYTNDSFIPALETRLTRASMNGKSRVLDNVFVERLRRTLKHEEVYLKAHNSVPELKGSPTEWFIVCSEVKPHQNVGRRTPEEIDREVLHIKEEVHEDTLAKRTG
jgi:putative transposase